MTQQQWDEHKEHMEEHIAWPAKKEDILAACAGGGHVTDEVMSEIKSKLSEGKDYTMMEFKQMMGVM